MSEGIAAGGQKLDEWTLYWILDNTFGNIFVSGADGKILFVNKSASDVFQIPREQLMKMNTSELIGAGLIDRSTTMEAIRSKSTVIAPFTSKFGKEYFAISTPMQDKDGNISIVMTYSQEQKTFKEFDAAIQHEKQKAEKYREALNYYTNSNEMTPIIGKNSIMKHLYAVAAKFAQVDSTILITGESGTGKDVMATYIHRNSKRKGEPFIPVNCSVMPVGLIESELFGYEKGSFTGASKTGKPGFFELANGGTLFLDEVGELPLDVQAKFLRVLENREFTRVGGTKTLKSDFRLIVATNRDLKEMVRENRFREDLYYRLNVVPINMPPLRERREDIQPLAEHFLSDLNRKYSYNKKFSAQIMDAFLRYDWPGNVRELKNLIERLVIISTEDELINVQTGDPLMSNWIQNNQLGHISSEQVEKRKAESPGAKQGSIEANFSRMRKQQILDVMLQCGGNKTEVAKKLGISRGKLYRLLSDL